MRIIGSLAIGLLLVAGATLAQAPAVPLPLTPAVPLALLQQAGCPGWVAHQRTSVRESVRMTFHPRQAPIPLYVEPVILCNLAERSPLVTKSLPAGGTSRSRAERFLEQPFEYRCSLRSSPGQ